MNNCNNTIRENYRNNQRQLVYCGDQQWCDGRHLPHKHKRVPSNSCSMTIPQFHEGTNRYVTQEEARQWCAESAYDPQAKAICNGPPVSNGGHGWECRTWEDCMTSWTGHTCKTGCAGACKKCRAGQSQYCG